MQLFSLDTIIGIFFLFRYIFLILKIPLKSCSFFSIAKTSPNLILCSLKMSHAQLLYNDFEVTSCTMTLSKFSTTVVNSTYVCWLTSIYAITMGLLIYTFIFENQGLLQTLEKLQANLDFFSKKKKTRKRSRCAGP